MAEKHSDKLPLNLMELNKTSNIFNKIKFNVFLHRLMNILHDPDLGLPHKKSFILHFFMFLLALFIAFLLTPQFLHPVIEYYVGDVAISDIKARKDILVEDLNSTEKNKIKAAENSPIIFDLNEDRFVTLTNRIDAVFTAMKEELNKNPANKYVGKQPVEGKVLSLKEKFEELADIKISDKDILFLKKENFSKNIKGDILLPIEKVYKKFVAGFIPPDVKNGKKQVAFRSSKTGPEKILNKNSDLIDLKEANVFLTKIINSEFGDKPLAWQMTVNRISSAFLTPNVSYNQEATEQNKKLAIKNIEPVFYQIKKGEMIVREGERISPVQLIKLQQLFASGEGVSKAPFILFFNFLSSLFLLIIMYFGLKKHYKNFPDKNKDILFIGIVIIICLILLRIFLGLAEQPNSPGIGYKNNFIGHLTPFCLGGLIISTFFTPLFGILFAIFLAVFGSFITNTPIIYGSSFFISGIVAASLMSGSKNRRAPLNAGFLIGCINAVFLVLLYLSQHELLAFTSYLSIMFYGFFSGILAGILASGLIPLFEMLFGYTTDMRLLELASLDSTLLKKLMINAPGTYHHSIVVGNMVEAAAREIDANPLVAKVGALYHDIGKIKKPLYFIENQQGEQNRHEKLAPSMSSLILISHVKDGLEMARRYGLGEMIFDVIQQHHGTSLISYFFNKAIKQREQLSDDKKAVLHNINVENFRYPGPCPQNKEAGLVMLADSVEAASRTLQTPTPARVQGLVQKIIMGIFNDGQLNECEITLKDLHLISRAFVKILTGMFHHRIEYPELDPKALNRKVNENLNH